MNEGKSGVVGLLRGKYELLELAGTGGMAEVYRGRAHGAAGFRRPVAIKRILDVLSCNDEFVQMFVEEARVCSELDHPNIVQIHDFDLDNAGRYFLVMEWIEGLDLAEWAQAYELAKQHAPWALVTAIGIEILKGLGAAHERLDAEGQLAPIFHRDVTPHNVLLSTLGIVKLTDFGLARAMDRARMTRPHILKGKLTYTAPELVSGADPTAQSDLFSVGIVLYEALTGRKLFAGDSPIQILERVRAADAPPLSAIRQDLPPELASAIHRALAKNPEDRFRSARSMARTLANILRLTPASTSAEVLAHSVREARKIVRDAQGVVS